MIALSIFTLLEKLEKSLFTESTWKKMPTVRDRNVRKLRRMRKKAKARMKERLKELSTSEETE